MGRSNVVIVAFGLAACLCLSLIMRSALKLSSDKKIPQVVRELSERYGSQLSSPPEFWLESTLDGSFAYLEIAPLINSGGERLALSIGHFLWRGLDGAETPVGLVVQCRLADGRLERFQVRAPRQPGRAIRRLASGEVPSPATALPSAPRAETAKKSQLAKPDAKSRKKSVPEPGKSP